MSLDLSLVPDGGLHWLGASGEHAGIVLSSRIRLARNLAGYAFPPRAREGERLRVLHEVRDAVGRVPSLRDSAFVRVDECSPQERLLLHERHLVSRELAGLDQGTTAPGAGAVFVAGDSGLMVNEEDHLRLQVFRSGFDVAGALRDAERMDRELGTEVPYAWHHEFGFLTACPTNTGTGMRASFLVSSDPKLMIFDAPGLFQSAAHVHAALHDPAYRRHLETISLDKGLRINAVMYAAPTILLTRKPVARLADMIGALISGTCPACGGSRRSRRTC